MQTDLKYVREKLGGARRRLLLGNGNRCVRLAWAWRDLQPLSVPSLDPGMDADLRRHLERVRELLSPLRGMEDDTSEDALSLDDVEEAGTTICELPLLVDTLILGEAMCADTGQSLQR